jgi:hypothetical protein
MLVHHIERFKVIISVGLTFWYVTIQLIEGYERRKLGINSLFGNRKELD